MDFVTPDLHGLHMLFELLHLERMFLQLLLYYQDNIFHFENKTVLIDNFGGFTGQEYVILEQIFLQAKDCCLTLTADPEEERLFAPTLQHFYRLQTSTFLARCNRKMRTVRSIAFHYQP